MDRKPIIYICTSDISGKLRGKGILADRVDAGAEPEVGWTPTNVQITCFDEIAESPYGALGDLVLVGDPKTRARIEYGPTNDQCGTRSHEDFALGNVRHLDGRPWECCTRSILENALDRLKNVGGYTLYGAFEHEFHLPERRGGKGEGYAFAAFRSVRGFCESVMAALEESGIATETIMKEYGPNQFEVTVRPVSGVKIADDAAVLREIVRGVGEREGQRVSFAPLIEPGGIGNGVHIHLSFRDSSDCPAAYDAAGPAGMSRETGSFIAGVLKQLPAIVSLLAPSVVSYSRLVPHRWSAAYNNLGAQDREAAVRLCPIRTDHSIGAASQFNFEVRACDAAASPHLALAAIIHAGVAGMEEDLDEPEVTSEDLSLLSGEELEARGFRRLPESLSAALDEFEAAKEVWQWFPDDFAEIYLAHKRQEILGLEGRDEAEICEMYQLSY